MENIGEFDYFCYLTFIPSTYIYWAKTEDTEMEVFPQGATSARRRIWISWQKQQVHKESTDNMLLSELRGEMQYLFYSEGKVKKR